MDIKSDRAFLPKGFVIKKLCINTHIDYSHPVIIQLENNILKTSNEQKQ